MAGSWRTTIIVGVACLVVGAGAMAVVWPEPQPEWAQETTSGGSVEVTPRSFDDARQVDTSTVLAEEWSAPSPSSGVLRHEDCTVGGEVTSGTAPVLIDDRQVLMLHTDTPLWRGLARGDKGLDVTDLQNELIRLGYDLAADGVYGASTAAAVEQLWTSVGAPADTPLSMDRVVWLPEESMTISSCPSRVGQHVDPDDPLFTTGGDVTSLTLTWPDDMMPGDRVAVVGDATVEIPADGVITDPQFLARVADTPRFKDFASGATSTYRIDTSLVAPVEVVPVPPSALYSLSGSHGCVIGDGAPMSVQVVASQFGQTLVTADRLPTMVVVLPAEGSGSCG